MGRGAVVRSTSSPVNWQSLLRALDRLNYQAASILQSPCDVSRLTINDQAQQPPVFCQALLLLSVFVFESSLLAAP